jgi:hypothetical protein
MMSTSGDEQTGRLALDDKYVLLPYMTIIAMMLQFVGHNLSAIVFGSRPRRTGG